QKRASKTLKSNDENRHALYKWLILFVLTAPAVKGPPCTIFPKDGLSQVGHIFPSALGIVTR
ncbi:MAG: hypothetical protein LUC91_10255, partial [Prevotella sp.]|nr:hypothetical protein [Prevotella sp.]